jgi:hypothetical protein
MNAEAQIGTALMLRSPESCAIFGAAFGLRRWQR